MKKNLLCCLAHALLSILGLQGVLATQCGWGKVLTSVGCACLQCPMGQEPSRGCDQAEGPEVAVRCQVCPGGTFSDRHGPELCRPHTSCPALNRVLVNPGTAGRDAICGDCSYGFSPAAIDKSSTLDACVKLPLQPLARVSRNVANSSPRGMAGAAINATNVRSSEEKTTEYAVFALVPIFCVMGLIGILICNILKKKGYNCTAEKEGGDEEAPMPQKEGNAGPYIVDEPYEDTISVLVRLITEKKENAAALEELLLEYESKQMAISKTSSIKFPVLPHLAQFRSLPRLCPHRHHLHTINGLAPRTGTGCSRCSQKKWPELLLPIDTKKSANLGAKNPLPGEVTILSVGRFQVAQIPEQKPDCLELTPTESSDTDSVDTSHTEPVDEKSLLGVTSSSSSRTKSKQEDRKLFIRLGETNLNI